jgi:hypothetical protein
MAHYGTHKSWAAQLGLDEAVSLFEATLQAEIAKDHCSSRKPIITWSVCMIDRRLSVSIVTSTIGDGWRCVIGDSIQRRLLIGILNRCRSLANLRKAMAN